MKGLDDRMTVLQDRIAKADTLKKEVVAIMDKDPTGKNVPIQK